MLIDASRADAHRPDAPPLAVVARPLGVQTNNYAEYTAVVLALERALELGAREVELVLDSKLAVEQLMGRWRVREATLAPLHAKASQLLRRFDRWGLRHEGRASNAAADALANLALDDPAGAAAAEAAQSVELVDFAGTTQLRLGADFGSSWRSLPEPARRSLQAAYRALRAGGLGCGAVLTSATGAIIAEGRNHAYDAPDGSDVLEGSPLAHAELNALARVSNQLDLSRCTLWTTQEPCSMCTAAVRFTGVGLVRYLAPDPWALATGQSRHTAGARTAEEQVRPEIRPLDDERLLVASNLIFLLSIARSRGRDHPTVSRNAELEPETHELVLTQAEKALPPSVDDFLGGLWPKIEVAAAQRERRLA